MTLPDPQGVRVSASLGHELQELTSRQRRPVLHVGSSAVQAGPGSGKTRVLVAKAAYLLETAVAEPQRIACITFTRSAALEIRERSTKLAPAASRRIWCGTVHGFCLNVILRPYSHLAGMPPITASILTSRQRVATLQAAMDAAGIGEELASLKTLDNRGTRIRRRVALDEAPAETDDPRWLEFSAERGAIGLARSWLTSCVTAQHGL